MRVEFRHARQAGFCVRGFIAWANACGFDWKKFLREGAPVEEIEALKDAMADRVAKIAREEGAR